MKRVEKLNDKEITELDNDVLRIGNEAVRKAKEENRKHGLPEVFVKAGKLYYLLPSGEVTDVRPKILD